MATSVGCINYISSRYVFIFSFVSLTKYVGRKLEYLMWLRMAGEFMSNFFLRIVSTTLPDPFHKYVNVRDATLHVKVINTLLIPFGRANRYQQSLSERRA